MTVTKLLLVIDIAMKRLLLVIGVAIYSVIDFYRQSRIYKLLIANYRMRRVYFLGVNTFCLFIKERLNNILVQV